MITKNRENEPYLKRKMRDEELEEMGELFADIGLWRMCIGVGVDIAASDQLHFIPCAFPFHVPHLDARRLHSGEQVGDGSQSLRHLEGSGGQRREDTPVAGLAESEAGRCAGVPLSLSALHRQHLDGHAAVLCEALHRPSGRHGGDTERMLLDKRNEKGQTVGTDGHRRRILGRRAAMECGIGVDGAGVGSSACACPWSGGDDGHADGQDVRQADSVGAETAFDGSES